MDKESSDLLDQLRQDALRIADRFQLQFRAIAAEHPRVKSRYGVCYQDGLIKIRLRHVKSGRVLKYSSLVNTLCHEMAHLRHFNHGPEFKALFLRILAWARREGIYQPGPQGSQGRPGPWIETRRRAQGSLKVPRRNGVPIFPPEPAERGQILALPWERNSAPLAVNSSAPANFSAERGEGEPAAAPSQALDPSPRTTSPAAPSQTPVPSPRTTSPTSSRASHPASRQLSLF